MLVGVSCIYAVISCKNYRAMATRVKIKTYDDAKTHFDTHLNNYTLCGLETGGDEGLSIKIAQLVKRKVNCQDCIRIVEFCHAIKRSEWE